MGWVSLAVEKYMIHRFCRVTVGALAAVSHVRYMCPIMTNLLRAMYGLEEELADLKADGAVPQALPEGFVRFKFIVVCC